MHDHNGKPLKVGDTVNIPCVIRELHGGTDFCNVTVVTVHGRKPDGLKEVFSAINTHQLEKVDAPAVQETVAEAAKRGYREAMEGKK